MSEYRFLGRRLRRGPDETITYNDTFEPTDEELRAFGDLIEPVPDGVDIDSAGESTTETESTTSDASNPEGLETAGNTDAPIDPREYTVDELDDYLADADHSDAELTALADAEESGKDRTSALESIEDARSRDDGDSSDSDSDSNDDGEE